MLKYLCYIVTTMSGVEEKIEKIMVDIKTHDASWERIILLFYDEEKYEQAMKIIEEELGFRSNYVIFNKSTHPLNEYDYRYAITVHTYYELLRLADEVIEEDP